MTHTTPEAPPLRLEGARKVAGTAPYAADAVPRPHLFGAVIESPLVGHVTVDLEAARQVEGVVAALGPEDDPGVLWCVNPHGAVRDTRVFTAEPRFAGDAVGAVAARTRAALDAALAAVEVRQLPGRTSSAVPFGSLVADVAYGQGEDMMEAALAGAPHVFTATYTVEPAPHGFIERPCAAARWAGDGGHLQVWSTTQTPAAVGVELARILSLPPADVIVEPVYVGGGFGGKEEVQLEPAAALLSRAAGGLPVLVEISRSTTNGRFRVRHGATLTLRTGVDDAGVLLAREVVLELDAGAYAGHSPDVAAAGAARAYTLYPAPVTRSVGRARLSATTPATGFRGYGGTETLFAVEGQLDEIADALGLDSVELRLRNVLRPGAADPLHAWPVETFAAERCLRAAVEESSRRWPAPDPQMRGIGRWRTGRGVALLLDTSSKTRRTGVPDQASARCRLAGGTYVVETGSVEIGQGNHTAFAVVAAQELGVPVSDVRVEQPPTGTAPEDPGVYGARGAYVTAGAVALAARALRRRVGTHAAYGKPPPEECVAEATFQAPDNALCAGAQAVEVVVDTWTGAVRVTRVVSVHDVGRVLHATLATGQVVGGVVQGVGTALTERAPRDRDGVAQRPTLLDHLLPTVLDAPEVDVVFVTGAHPHSPTGAKGLGEAPVMGVAPAIANAVADATGLRLRSLPMHPERVLAALDAHTDARTDAHLDRRAAPR